MNRPARWIFCALAGLVAAAIGARVHPAICVQFSRPKPAALHMSIPPPAVDTARFIARHYEVSPVRARQITDTVFRVSREHRINPYLVLAVIAIESSFRPRVINRRGDAYGLMQIEVRAHQWRVAAAGGRSRLFRVTSNIRIGVALLVRYGARAGARAGPRLKHALWRYSGGEFGYARRVLRLSALLQQKAQQI
jgi:soluble lytic murein transglycosylase-like protein